VPNDRAAPVPVALADRFHLRVIELGFGANSNRRSQRTGRRPAGAMRSDRA
jgi:hypothetical protein